MKKFLAIYVFAVLAVALGATTSRAGTIAHWMFEEAPPGTIASGPNSVIDSSVNALHGTALGGPVYQGGLVSGTGTNGLGFDGVNDTVRVVSGSTGPLALTGDFTIELGMNVAPSSSDGFGVFYGDSQGGLDPYWFSVNNNGKLTFQIYGGSSGTQFLSTGDGAIDLGVTTQVAAVFDYDDIDGSDNIMSIYVDRILVASVNAGATTPFYGDTVSDFWIGSVDNQGGYFTDALTDVKISNPALTSSEMMLVPEPGMMAIFGLGLLALGLSRRKRT